MKKIYKEEKNKLKHEIWYGKKIIRLIKKSDGNKKALPYQKELLKMKKMEYKTLLSKKFKNLHFPSPTR